MGVCSKSYRCHYWACLGLARCPCQVAPTLAGVVALWRPELCQNLCVWPQECVGSRALESWSLPSPVARRPCWAAPVCRQPFAVRGGLCFMYLTPGTWPSLAGALLKHHTLSSHRSYECPPDPDRWTCRRSSGNRHAASRPRTVPGRHGWAWHHGTADVPVRAATPWDFRDGAPRHGCGIYSNSTE